MKNKSNIYHLNFIQKNNKILPFGKGKIELVLQTLETTLSRTDSSCFALYPYQRSGPLSEMLTTLFSNPSERLLFYTNCIFSIYIATIRIDNVTDRPL
jgi:hypothetical protein